MARKTSRKSARVPRKAAASRIAAKAAGPHRAAARSPERASASERIDRRIAELGDWRGERLAAIRRLIHEIDPEVVEEWKWLGSPAWSHEGVYVVANAHKDKVKLTFSHGAELPDPEGLFNATLKGSKWRALDLREGDELDETALGALLREAVAYNVEHSKPRSKASRTPFLK
jgi:hypothetical protein